jgi:hypothetical protein
MSRTNDIKIVVVGVIKRVYWLFWRGIISLQTVAGSSDEVE